MTPPGGERAAVDVDRAGDPVGTRVSCAVDDGAAPGMPDEHDGAVKAVDRLHDGIDVILQADAGPRGFERLFAGQGQRVHAMAGRDERRRHV